MAVYKITKIEENQPEASYVLTQDQMDMVAMALNEYQDTMYDEDSPYYDDYEASLFSQLQGFINTM